MPTAAHGATTLASGSKGRHTMVHAQGQSRVTKGHSAEVQARKRRSPAAQCLPKVLSLRQTRLRRQFLCHAAQQVKDATLVTLVAIGVAKAFLNSAASVMLLTRCLARSD